MNKLISLLPLIVLVGIACFVLPSCRNLGTPLRQVRPIGVPALCKKGDSRFETPTFTLGQKYGGPGPVYNNGKGLSVNIEAITQRTGQKFFGFGDIVVSPPHPFGNGQMIHLNVCVLSFDLPQGTHKVEFDYLDQGGTINLGAG